MSLGNWDPNEAHSNIDIKQIDLEEIIQLGNIKDVEHNCKHLNESQLEKSLLLIKQDKNFWVKMCEEKPTDAILNLIYFFTVAEEQNSVLSAGNESSVIALTKILKGRGENLGKENLQWIRNHSSNRFLPNGSIF